MAKVWDGGMRLGGTRKRKNWLWHVLRDRAIVRSGHCLGLSGFSQVTACVAVGGHTVSRYKNLWRDRVV